MNEDDFDRAPQLEMRGGIAKAREVFGEWESLILLAQIANLPCRRLSIGGAGSGLARRNIRGLAIRDAADCQSALQPKQTMS
jgi:hypothetical protein